MLENRRERGAVRCDKCIKLGGHWSVFGFISKRQCFKTGVGSYRKPVEGVLQWGCVGKPGEVENKSCSCILDQFQMLDGAQKMTCQEQVAVIQS